MTNETEAAWPDMLKIRDAKVHDALGGSGRRIYTTAGNGYERKEYIRKDLSDAKDKRIEELGKDHTLSVSFSRAAAVRIAELEAYTEQLEETIKNMTAHIRVDPDE